MNEEDTKLNHDELKTIRFVVALIVTVILIIVASLVIDEAVDGIGERQCIEKVGSVMKDGYAVCDL